MKANGGLAASNAPGLGVTPIDTVLSDLVLDVLA